MDKQRFAFAASGVVATNITPFARDGELDLAALRRNLELLVEGKSDMIVVCGNSAEYSSLLPDEVIGIAREAVSVVSARCVTLVGIGGPIATALELAKAVFGTGADGVMVHEPAHVHASHDGVARYYEAICDAAPELAVVPYKRSEARLPDLVLERLLQRSNLAGVKYAEPNPRAALGLRLRTRSTSPDSAWINGLAECWAPSFHSAGFHGFTSGLVNVAPELATGLRDALRRADHEEVERLWTLVAPFEDLRAKHRSAYNVPVVKEAAAQLGLCERTVRLPLTDITPEDRRRVSEILEAWGKL
jgi:4-hydroxy-tetrahydrodipicolinate synthase